MGQSPLSPRPDHGRQRPMSEKKHFCMSRHFASFLFAFMFLCTFDGLAQVPECAPLRLIRNVMGIDAVRQEFIYSQVEKSELALDIYYPRSKKPPAGYPVIVWFHGGGWISGSKRQDVFVRHFASHGFAVASVQYRLALREEFPAQARDARTACHWLWKNAAELNLDPECMMLAGQSSGAHLALLTAYTEGRNLPGWGPALPRGTVKAVAAMYPPTELLKLVGREAMDSAVHPVALLLGAEVQNRIRLAREASPVYQTRPGVPPTLLVHGTEDVIIPVEQSKLLANRLHRIGAPVTLLMPKEGHAFSLFPDKIINVLQFLETVPALRNRSTSDVSPKPLPKDMAASNQNPRQSPGRSLAH